MAQNNIVMGIPRSGTSLLLKLLSSRENVIALGEPPELKKIRNQSPSQQILAQKVYRLFEEIRTKISRGEPVAVALKKGTRELAENYYCRNASGVVENIKEYRDVCFPFSFSSATIYIKANLLFTATLNGLLNQKFDHRIAVVRDPEAVIHSWRSLDLPVSKGMAKIGEIYSHDLRAISTEGDLLIRQVKILDWYFKRYYEYRRNLKIIYYEDMIKSPTILGKIDPGLTESLAQTKLHSMNQNIHYDFSESPEIRKALTQHGVYWKKFYPEVEND